MTKRVPRENTFKAVESIGRSLPDIEVTTTCRQGRLSVCDLQDGGKAESKRSPGLSRPSSSSSPMAGPVALASRLAEIVEALPPRPGLRVLEIGCGSGAAARAVARRTGKGHVLGIDRSAKAIIQAVAGSHAEIASGRLRFRQVAIENFELEPAERRYDLAFAVRVGALDGRHPEAGRVARQRIRLALVKGGRLYIDGAIRFGRSRSTSS